ncbi:MAG: hypothetical protein RLZ51_2364, partial [Pseudomonadota bacterium]
MFQSNEGELNPLGMTVGAMVQTSDILGFSGQPVQAIALERLDDRMGTWQYRLDGSVTWLTIDASLINRETNTLGLLLRAQDSIRLLPFGDLNGDVASALTFRAWDASTGVAGSYAVTTPGSGAFGAATDTLALKVNPVNDAPDFVFSNALSMQGAGLGDETAYSIAQQADGRFIVAGVVEAGPGSYFSLMRLNLDGTLDATFGDHGKALIAMALNQENRAHDILIQADGKVLVG